MRVSQSLEVVDGSSQLTADDLSLLLEGSDRVTVIMGWADHVAELICRELDTLGISVPDKVAVVGFNGLNRQFMPKYGLTTIHAPWPEVGKVAVQHLTTLISGGTVPVETQLPVSFYHGTTS
jgi:LacI family transcriptional regulator